MLQMIILLLLFNEGVLINSSSPSGLLIFLTDFSNVVIDCVHAVLFCLLTYQNILKVILCIDLRLPLLHDTIAVGYLTEFRYYHCIVSDIDPSCNYNWINTASIPVTSRQYL